MQKSLQSIQKHSETTKMYKTQKMRKLIFEISRNIPTLPKASECIHMYPIVSEQIRTAPTKKVQKKTSKTFPKRKKLRQDSEEPTCVKSRIDRELPSLDMP